MIDEPFCIVTYFSADVTEPFTVSFWSTVTSSFAQMSPFTTSLFFVSTLVIEKSAYLKDFGGPMTTRTCRFVARPATVPACPLLSIW